RRDRGIPVPVGRYGGTAGERGSHRAPGDRGEPEVSDSGGPDSVLRRSGRGTGVGEPGRTRDLSRGKHRPCRHCADEGGPAPYPSSPVPGPRRLGGDGGGARRAQAAARGGSVRAAARAGRRGARRDAGATSAGTRAGAWGGRRVLGGAAGRGGCGGRGDAPARGGGR